MAGALRIALATESDVPAITALLAYTESPFDVEAELLRRYARLWVAATDAPVGFLPAWEVADELQLHDVVVAPSHRRQGIGRALMTALCAFAAERGARFVLLEVRKSNAAAIALYREFDFEVTGERSNYYANGEAALEMRRELRY